MRAYWLEQRESDVPRDDAWLTAAERARLSALRIPKRRTDWRLGRWTAKRALAAYFDFADHDASLAAIEIRTAACGAPEAYLGPEPAPVSISLSHREGLAACAVAYAGVQLGCDLELVEPRTNAFVADYFTAEEQQVVCWSAPSERERLIALMWSAKESALKALRAGLTLDTRSLQVCIAGNVGGSSGQWHPFHVGYDDGPPYDGWWRIAGGLVRTFIAAPSLPPPRTFESLAVCPADRVYFLGVAS